MYQGPNCVPKRRARCGFSTNPTPIYAVLTIQYASLIEPLNPLCCTSSILHPNCLLDRLLDARHIGLMLLSTLLLGGIRDSENEVDHNSKKENNGETSRAISIVKTGLPSHPDRFRTPVVRYQGIHHGSHRNDREEEGGDNGWSVTEVEHANGESSEDDGKVQP